MSTRIFDVYSDVRRIHTTPDIFEAMDYARDEMKRSARVKVIERDNDKTWFEYYLGDVITDWRSSLVVSR